MAVQSGTCFMCFMEHCSVEVRHCRTLTSQTTVLPYLALWLFRQRGCYSGEKRSGAILLAVGMRPHDSPRKVVFGVAV